MRIILVADHASIDFGGEAALPCHYFRVLLARNSDVHLVVHERSRVFLTKHFQEAEGRIHYVNDNCLHRFLHLFQAKLSTRIAYLSFSFLLYLLTQVYQKRIVRRLVIPQKTIVHQVIPVSPKVPSLMCNIGAPVVFGPLNGGMCYPNAFAHYESRFLSWFNYLGRRFSGFFNRLLPGKLKAAMLLVSNQRTHDALPKGLQGEVKLLVDNGVDLSVWNNEPVITDDGVTRFIFLMKLCHRHFKSVVWLYFFESYSSDSLFVFKRFVVCRGCVAILCTNKRGINGLH